MVSRVRRLALVTAVLVTAPWACSKTPDPAPSVAPGSASGSATAPDESAEHAGKPRKHGDKHNPMIADAPPLALEVSVGGTVSTWNKDAFDKVARYAVGSDGDSRDVWSMRELATTLVGPGAHVVSVTNADGSKPMDATAWADTTKTPILHTTRRGTLKFAWADANGAWGDTVVKDVTRIEIAR